MDRNHEHSTSRRYQLYRTLCCAAAARPRLRGDCLSSRQDQHTCCPTLRHLHGDRSQLADHVEQFRQLQPDVVIEMIAGQVSHGELLMNIFPGITRRLVLVSSCDVYRAYDRFSANDPGEPDPTPLTESSPLRDKTLSPIDNGQRTKTTEITGTTKSRLKRQ